MLFLKSWLEDYINLSDYTNSELLELISTKSSEVDEIYTVKDYFNNKVLIGKIVNVQNHPNADRLKIFEVDFAGKHPRIQIVSAAPNVEEGLIVPTAVLGAKLPGMFIETRKMRGEESQGMCCGKSELLLETSFSSGLWELNQILNEEHLGLSICQALPEVFEEEVVLDIDILPDRVALIGSHLGMALELARVLQKPELLTQKTKDLISAEFVKKSLQKIGQNSSQPLCEYEDETDYTNIFSLFNLDLNPQKNLPFEYRLPHNLAKRLFLTEKNILGGTADLSNYLLFDIGQPNHFANQSKLNSNKIYLNSLIKQKSFKGLGNADKIVLPVGAKVLIDENEEVIALPGIVGGQKTKVETEDSQILVEIANFDEVELSKNTFKTKIRTDSSKLFSGGINPARILTTLTRMQEILAETNPDFELNLNSLYIKELGYKLNNINDFFNYLLNPEKTNSVKVDLSYLAERLDGRKDLDWKEDLTKKLNLLGDLRENVLVLNPFYSRKLTKEALLNEILRLVGFENLQHHDLVLNIDNKQSLDYKANKKLRELFCSHGFDEVITRIFVSPDNLISYISHKVEEGELALSPEKFALEKLQVLKSHYPSETFVRDSLLPSLAKAVSQNIKNGFKEPRIFEINKVYNIVDTNLIEKKHLAMLGVANDPYIFTSVIQAISQKANQDLKPVKNLSNSNQYQNLGAVNFYQGKNTQVILMELSNVVKKQFSLPLNKHIFYLELDLTDWDLQIESYNKYQDTSAYPKASRSYSILTSKNTMWADIQKTAENISLDEIVVDVKPIERMSGENGQDIINFTVDFVSYQRTLTNEEILEWEKKLFTYLPEIELRK